MVTALGRVLLTRRTGMATFFVRFVHSRHSRLYSYLPPSLWMNVSLSTVALLIYGRFFCKLPPLTCSLLKSVAVSIQRNKRSWRNDRFHPCVLAFALAAFVAFVTHCLAFVACLALDGNTTLDCDHLCRNTLLVDWSRDLWRHVTLKTNGATLDWCCLASHEQ